MNLIFKSGNSCMNATFALGALLPILAQLAGAVTTTDGIILGTGNTVLTGSGSIASGVGNSSNENSISIGYGNSANFYSIAMGDQSTANWGSLSCGGYNVIDENSAYSLTAGEWNYLGYSYSSVLFGASNGAGMQYGSAAIGIGNTMNFPFGKSGGGNILLGQSNQIDATVTSAQNDLSSNVLLGSNNYSSTSSSYILGEGNIGQSGTVTLGTNAATVSNASLIVGTGTGAGETPRANGLVVLKNGTVSIPSGVLQLGSDTAVTTGYLSTNKYLQQTTPGATVSSGGIAAWGWGAQATAAHTLALGEGSAATAAGSLSIGVQAHATNVSSVAIGPFTTATGFGSLAMQGGLAEGYFSTAIGRYNHAKGSDSIAIGYDSLTGVDATLGLAVGANTIASSLGSAAVGFHAESSGFTSSAFGAYANAAQRDSTAIGFGTKTVSLASIAIGSCNVGTAGNSGWAWIETDPIFELGNGYNGVRSNAISTLKNGRSTLINKFWSASAPLADPSSADDSGGEALVVDGHTRLRGKVVIEQPQGDISMGIYGN